MISFSILNLLSHFKAQLETLATSASACTTTPAIYKVLYQVKTSTVEKALPYKKFLTPTTNKNCKTAGINDVLKLIVIH